MEYVTLGQNLRKRRKALGKTQEELAEGLCSPITISRIENGRQNVDFGLLKLLLQRLRLPESWVYTLVSTHQADIARLQKQVVSRNVSYLQAAPGEQPRLWWEAIEKIQDLERQVDSGDFSTRQEILRSRVLLGREDGPYACQEAAELLTDALRLTLPNFQLKKLRDGMYTETEIKLINQLAVSYIHAGAHHQAIDILRPLLDYLRGDNETNPGNWLHVPMVAYNYARELCAVGRYSAAVDVAMEGKGVCIQSGNYLQMPHLLAVLAECRYHTGDLEESGDYYRQAFYLYKALDDAHNQEIIRREAGERLGLRLE